MTSNCKECGTRIREGSACTTLCDDCYYRLEEESRAATCQQCGGSGKVPQERWSGDWGAPSGPCPSCGGTGEAGGSEKVFMLSMLVCAIGTAIFFLVRWLVS